jgi:integrase
VRGHLQERGDGVWRLFVDAAPDPLTGRRRQRTRTFRGTRKQADTALAKLVTETAGGRHDNIDKITISALIDAWLEVVGPNLEPNTLRGYRSKIATHIAPTIGRLRIAKATTHDFDRLYAAMTAAELAPNTVLGVHRILHTAFEQGRKWKWVHDNPVSDATPPRPEKDEPADLDPEMVAKAIDTAPEGLRNIALLAAITGAREAELCGLRWTDLDRRACTIRIQRRVVWVKGGHVIRPLTKTKKPRLIGLDRRTVARLRIMHYHARLRAAACGSVLPTDAFVFSETPDGQPVKPNVISQRWVRHRDRLGLDLTFHQLRHWHVSTLLDEGHRLARVSRRAGHARESTTSDIYSHVMRTSDHDLADTVARKLPRG